MTKRNKMLIAYLSVMCVLTFVRICFREEFFGELDDIVSDRLFSVLAQVVCMGLIPLITLAVLCEKPRSFRSFLGSFGLKPLKSGKVWLICIVIAIAQTIINSGVSTVWSTFIKATGYTSVVSDPDVYADFGAFLLSLFFSALLPGIFEEITHRGLMLRAAKGSEHIKIILAALLFALMHQNIMQTGYTFVGGIIFGYLFVCTGSILPAMVAHFINNAFVAVQIYSESHNGLISRLTDWVFGISSEFVGAFALGAIWFMAAAITVVLLKKLYLSRKADENHEQFDALATECETHTDILLGKILWVAIFAIGILTTAYSYIWGILR